MDLVPNDCRVEKKKDLKAETRTKIDEKGVKLKEKNVFDVDFGTEENEGVFPSE